MSQKILVTGAAGFIGSHTVDRLLAVGHQVWGVDNFRTGRRENLTAALASDAFTFTELDVAEEQQFADFVGRVRPNAIIHLAALVSVPESIRNPALNHRLNFQATQVVVEASRHHSVQRLVFASSAAVYGNTTVLPIHEETSTTPLSPYGEAKLASENLLLAESSRGKSVARCQRYFNVYGPRQDPRSPYSGVISIFLDHLRRKSAPTIFGDGEQTRDFISVFDVARANVVAATEPALPSGVANICTGGEVSINRVWETLSADLGSPLRPTYARARDGDIRRSCGSPKEARVTLGFQATVPLNEGLRFLAKEHLPPAVPHNGAPRTEL